MLNKEINKKQNKKEVKEINKGQNKKESLKITWIVMTCWLKWVNMTF